VYANESKTFFFVVYKSEEMKECFAEGQAQGKDVKRIGGVRG
jgi:hypothetical protein